MEGSNKRGKQHQVQDMSGKQVNKGKEQSGKEANEGEGEVAKDRQGEKTNGQSLCDFGASIRRVAVVVAPGRCRCRRQGCRRRRVVAVVALKLSSSTVPLKILS